MVASDAARRPLTIAHVTGENDFSGGEVQLFLLMEGLERAGHRGVLLCPPSSRSEQRALEQGLEVHPVAMRHSYSLSGVWRSIAALRRCQPDLVHLHTGRANMVGGVAAARLGIPAITTRRMDRPVSRELRTRWLYGRGVRHAVAISSAVRERLLEGGAPAEKTSIIPSAVDPAVLRSTRERGAIRRELGVADDTLCLLVLAALVRRKGIDVLLEAMARIASTDTPALRLLIAGDGEERPTLEAQCRSLGLGERVCFLGRREDKPELLAACDVLVLPSRQEGLGVAALEAMACSRAVVASSVGGLAEVVGHGETGLLVPPEDPAALAEAIATLARDIALRERLSAAGPKRVAGGHLTEQMCNAYEALYRRVLAAAAS